MSETQSLVDTQTQGWAISAALKKPAFRQRLQKLCAPIDFAGPDRLLFEALASQDGRFDPLAFDKALGGEGHKRLLEIEADFLQMPDEVTFEKWLKAITGHSEARQVSASLGQSIQRLKAGDPVEVVTGDLLADLVSIREHVSGETVIPIAQAVERVRDLLKRSANGEEHIETVPTGFADLDKTLGGLMRKHICTLGGRPGQGKTQMGLQIARNVALWAKGQGRKSAVIIFSAEMSDERLVMRLASAASGVSTKAVRKNTASDAERVEYYKALDLLETLPIHVDESPAPSTRQMLNRVAVEAAQYPDGIDLVVFDYLELAGETQGDNSTGDDRIGKIMRGLKIIAKRFNCPVLVISQLNRDVEKRSTRLPELADLRASGWIEALSQQVIFIMRPDAYAVRDEKTGKLNYDTSALAEMAARLGEGAAIVRIAKNRDEETGVAVMRFVSNITRLAEKSDTKPQATPRDTLDAARKKLEAKDVQPIPDKDDLLDQEAAR